MFVDLKTLEKVSRSTDESHRRLYSMISYRDYLVAQWLRSLGVVNNRPLMRLVGYSAEARTAPNRSLSTHVCVRRALLCSSVLRR